MIAISEEKLKKWAKKGKLEKLVNLLRKESYNAHNSRLIFEAIGEIGNDQAISALCRIFTEEVSKIGAASALAKIGSPAVVTLLNALARIMRRPVFYYFIGLSPSISCFLYDIIVFLKRFLSFKSKRRLIMFRVRNTVWIAILTIITALLVGSCAKDAPRVDTTEGLKKALLEPDPGSILVLSVPSKLKIYFGENTEKKEPEKTQLVPMKKSHPLIEEKNLKGETPLLLQDMKPGNYLLGIAPIIALHPNFKRGNIDNTLTVNSIVVFGGVPTGYPPPKEASKGAAIYSLTKKENTPLRVIVLAYPQDAGLEELKPLYPADDVFQFDEPGFLADLKKQTATLFSESQSNDIVSLLRRGGKISVTFGDIKIMSEIKVDQTWELKTLARINKKARKTGTPVEIDAKGKVITGTPGSGKTQDSKVPIRLTGAEKPKLIKKVKPKYPEIAMKARIQGKVILDVAVDIYGRVIPGSIKVLRGQPLLRQAAVDAVKQWVYEPYIKEGVPKSVRFTLVVDFSL